MSGISSFNGSSSDATPLPLSSLRGDGENSDEIETPKQLILEDLVQIIATPELQPFLLQQLLVLVYC
ncbi:hypothetical protein Tco_1387617 [Tanacetum coccineum]